MEDFDLELRTTFLEEAQSILDDTEGAFLRLEQSGTDAHSPEDQEALESIFRLAHNFKGSASAVGFSDLATLAHRMEDVLGAIRQKKIPKSPGLVTLLLTALDRLKAFVAGLQLDPGYTQDNTLIIEDLEKAAQGNFQSPAAEPQAKPKQQPNLNASPTVPAATSATAAAIQEAESIRVSTIKLDHLLNRVGELVVNQSILGNHRRHGTASSDQALQTVTYMEKIVAEIQDVSMSLRMVPIKPLFTKMSRVVRDLARAQNKNITLVTDGDHVEIDKLVLERITDPLTHLIRNAVDHGIESTELRTERNKNPESQIVLHANHVEDRVIITVMDDGRGLDPQLLRKKAIEKGVITSDARLTDDECYGLIFRPGFSTKEQVTDISGRGVGLDVVQQAVNDLKGAIEIKTKLGEGTGFVISLPLSLSIIPGLIVRLGKQFCVLPVSQLLEIVDTSKFKVHTSASKGRMIQLRGEIIPVLSLKDTLGFTDGSRAPEERQAGVITSRDGKKFCFSIDEIIGQQQIVIKKLGPEVEEINGLLGGAILSTAEPSLIIDLADLTPRSLSSRSTHVAA